MKLIIDVVNCLQQHMFFAVKLACLPDKEFKCRDSGHCIPIAERCNDYSNCRDGSDELHCKR